MFGLIMFSAQTFAQKTVSGKVVDEQDMTLPGVNVIEKGTTNGTITDIDGNYTLQVKDNAVLVFSYMGFDEIEISAANGTRFDVTMKENTKEIDEVVVVGYGTMKKSDVAGSSISVSSEDIATFVGSSVDQALQGKAAGVQVITNSGQPGGGMTVQIRGQGTLSTNAQPLYVIDGVPVQNMGQDGHAVGLGDAIGNGQGTFSGLSNLNPDDIESMEILKDASATAIYGSRAANGVVLITTKKGKKGKANFNYIGTYGVAQQSTKLDLLDLKGFAEYSNALRAETKGRETTPEYMDPSLLGSGTDWQDAIFRTAHIQTHQLSAAGGTDNARYYISAGYYDQEGTMLGSDYKRFSTRVNLDADLTSWLKVGTNTSFSNSQDHLGLTNSEDGILSQAYQSSPDIPVYNMDGSWSGDDREGSAGRVNPVGKAINEENKLKRYDLTSSLWAEISFYKDLKFRTEYCTNNLWTDAYHFEPTYKYGSVSNTSNEVRHQKSRNGYWEVKNYLTYTHTFADVHSITAMAGQETSEWNSEYLSGFGLNLKNNNFHEPGLAEASSMAINSGKSSGARVSVFGRFFYGFDGKYNLTYTYRRDGSSNFGPDKRWGNFHSVAAAWNIHKEVFMESLSNTISQARLRLGWGQVGNDNIGGYKWGAQGASNTNGLGSTYQVDQIPNTKISWETQESWNLGIDLGFLKDRFTAILEFYNKISKDMLMEMQLPSYMGTTGNSSLTLKAPTGNFGEIQNKGFEITINTVNINKKGFEWTTNFQFSRNKNELVSLSGSGNSAFFGNAQWDDDHISISQEGNALYQFYGYKTDGIYQDIDDLLNSPKTTDNIGRASGIWIGDIKYKDISGPDGVPDGKIDENDRTVIGNPNPKFTCGLTNTFTYKGFELGIFLTASYGNDILNYMGRNLSKMQDLWTNQLDIVKDRTILECIDETISYPQERSFTFTDRNGETQTLNIKANDWYDDPLNVKIKNSDTDIPRQTVGNGTGTTNNTYISDRYIEDGSYIKIKSISLTYNIPQKYTKMAKMEAVKVYASVSNLYTFTKYTGLDPEIGTSSTSNYVIGMDNGRYPTPRIVTFGINISF